ncbi:MFS transporter [Enemella evansiae]|nr:MFS transporter [Enemella evansiae]OYN99276.1 MFS transporter [Enemella evansiae]
MSGRPLDERYAGAILSGYARSPVSDTSTRSQTRPSRYAAKALMASSVGYAMDGFDLLILSFSLAAIAATFGLNTGQSGMLATVTLIGAVLGGFIGGIASDRIGRVKVLTISILVFAIFTAATGLAPNHGLLVLFRFLSGIGLGAEYGVGMTLATEAWPAKWRARAASFVAVGWQVGVLLAAAVSAWALSNPAIGWRGLFLIGAIPAVLAFFTRRHVDEPEMYTQMKRSSNPLRELFNSPERTRYSIAIVVLTSVQNFGYYGLMVWLPSFLSKQHGFSVTKSALWTAVTVIGMIIGILVFGFLADRVGRRPMFIIYQLGAAITVVAYSQLSSPMALLIGGAIMGAFVNGMMGGYGALTAELFPTHARGTAQNVLFNVGRGVGGFAPWLIGLVAGAWSFGFAIGLLALIYVLDLIVTIFLVPERRGASLDGVGEGSVPI